MNATEINARTDRAHQQGAKVGVRYQYGVHWAEIRHGRRYVMHVAKTFERALLGALETWEAGLS